MDPQAIPMIKGFIILSYFLAGISFLEFYFMRHRKKIGDTKESLANFSIWVLNRPIKLFLTSGITLSMFMFFNKYAIYAIPVNGWTIALTVVAADFTYYWKHRVSHEVRGLWSYHSVHHSSQEFNLSTAIRLPFYGVFTGGLFYIPALLVGFDPVILLVSKFSVLIYQYWVHTEMIGKLGWFDKLFNSPSNHRVHHGSNPQYIDKNHAGIFMIWDRMFGTYVEEKEKVSYGLTTPINTKNPFKIAFFELIEIIKDMAALEGWKNRFLLLLKIPGWQPSQVPVMKTEQ
jgi:sterol desaturase/sphingolipid hydroxylase (fatty acid hydroxylase superfamily)